MRALRRGPGTKRVQTPEPRNLATNSKGNKFQCFQGFKGQVFFSGRKRANPLAQPKRSKKPSRKPVASLDGQTEGPSPAFRSSKTKQDFIFARPIAIKRSPQSPGTKRRGGQGTGMTMVDRAGCLAVSVNLTLSI